MKDTIAQKHGPVTIGPVTIGPVTIGIDVSKAVLDVHLHPEGLRQRFANDSAGHAALIGWAAPHRPERVIFEPTGAYHRALETALGRAGLPLVRSGCRLAAIRASIHSHGHSDQWRSHG